MHNLQLGTKMCVASIFIDKLSQLIYLKLIDMAAEKKIFPENQWNMDEKGYLLG